MPKATRRASLLVRLFAWTVVFAFATTYAYELWTHPSIVVAGNCFLVAIVRQRRSTKQHLTELARAHAGQSICGFSRSFDTRKTDTWVIRAVYERLQLQLRWIYPHFPVQADSSKICGWIQTTSISICWPM